MRRRTFIAALGGAATWPLVGLHVNIEHAIAQRIRVPPFDGG